MKLVFSPSVCGDLSAFLANMEITVFLLNFFPSFSNSMAEVHNSYCGPTCMHSSVVHQALCQPKLYSGTVCFQLLPKFHFEETRGCFWGAVPPPLLQHDCLPLGRAHLRARARPQTSKLEALSSFTASFLLFVQSEMVTEIY